MVCALDSMLYDACRVTGHAWRAGFVRKGSTFMVLASPSWPSNCLQHTDCSPSHSSSWLKWPRLEAG